jgi:hypothetical protein
MYSHTAVAIIAGLGVTVVAEQAQACNGVWDSTVLVSFLTVTIPLLVGQWYANRKKPDPVAEMARLRAQLGIKDDGSDVHPGTNS